MNEWEKLFSDSFERLKKDIENRYRIEADGSGDPRRVAVHRAIEQLPCPVKVLQLQVDAKNYQHLKDELCPVVNYDFTKMDQFSVKYLGKVKPSDEKFVEILQSEFGINNAREFVQDFTREYNTKAQWEEDLSGNFQFVFYDPRNNIERFVHDFILMFDFNFIPRIAKDIKVVPDYNQIYNLKPDPILSEEELLSRYVGMTSFVKFEGNKTRTITVDDLQQDVAPVQLLPHINEHVRRVFDRAKKLYVFGWYVYDFFPVAEHYSVLALESAIKHRYFHHFPKDVNLRIKNGEKGKISNADYSMVMEFCRTRKDWNYRNLWVENEKFLYNMDNLLDWLVENKVISLWDKKRCELRMFVRNYLSHPTFSPIYPSNQAYSSIEESAFLINKMFSSIDNPTNQQ